VIRGTVLLVDNDERQVAEIKGLRFKRLSRESLPRTAGERQPPLLYDIQWILAPQETATAESAKVTPGDWLVLLDAGGIGEALAARLAESGHICTLVKPGDHFGTSADGALQIDLHDAEQYRLLLNQWPTAGNARRGVIHLWNLDSPALPVDGDELLTADATLGCQSLFFLLQAMAGAADAGDVKIWSVTRGACRTGGDEAVVSPLGALCWGLGRTAALEHAALWGGLIDLDDSPPDETARWLVDEITGADRESQVVLRGGQRLVPRLISETPPPHEEFDLAIRPDATYLITGGMGALGRQTAEWLIDRGARHVVLCGRSAASPEVVRVAAQWKSRGIDVFLLKADVSSPTDVKWLIAHVEQSGPPLRGIVHAAGVLDDGILVRQDWERFIKVLSPKAQGAWLLHSATRGTPLDFFIMYSSIASAFGSPAQGSYAAANAFLDAMAHYRRSTGDTALSVNWGPWAEAGMAAAANGSRARRPLRGLHALPPGAALTALELAISADAAQAVIVDADWHELASQFDPAAPPALLTSLTAGRSRRAPQRLTAPSADFTTRWRTAPPADRRELLLLHVKEQIAALLGMEIDELAETNQSLDDIGLDSLAGIQLRDSLSKALACPLPATLIFDCPTIDAMAEFLSSQLLVPVEDDATETAPTNDAPRRDHVAAELDELSEDQLAALLDDKLAAIDELTAD
jgi:NAD(P)-dependent dehydrogenase (short-subunit alcohol dehydrogenase family)/acyl carrier protein